MDDRKPVRVVLADDHQMFIEAIRMVLNQDDQIQVVEVVHNGDALIDSIRRLTPDVALVDVTMQGPGAEKICQEVARMDSRTRLVALTMHLDPGLADVLLQSGYLGYVVKDSVVAELVKATHDASAGRRYVSQAITVMSQNRSRSRVLTKREIDCLAHASEGLSNRAIADKLCISERTIKFHFENIFRKLNVVSRGEAVAAGRRLALI